MDNYQIVGIISIILLLVLMGPSAIRRNMARGVLGRNIAIWLAIFVAIVALYKFMH